MRLQSDLGLHCLTRPICPDTKNFFCNYRIYSVIRQSFSFQNNPKDLDPSSKMDLDLWDCLGRVKLVVLQNFIGLI